MTCTYAQCNANWVNENVQVEVPIHSKLPSMGSGLLSIDTCMWLCTMELSIHSKHVNIVLPGSEFMQVMIGALHMDLGSISCMYHALDVDMTTKLKNAVLNC